jgi:PAS domain S-box-containing protein
VGVPGLAHPEIQAQLLLEAVQSASVGLLVWDENRNYIAANAAACEILGTTLEELLGKKVGFTSLEIDDSDDVPGAIESIIGSGFATGTARVRRQEGGEAAVFYATFTTKSAGMPFMATMIARIG